MSVGNALGLELSEEGYVLFLLLWFLGRRTVDGSAEAAPCFAAALAEAAVRAGVLFRDRLFIHTFIICLQS